MISKTIGKGLAILLLSSPLLAAAQNAVPCTDSTATVHTTAYLIEVQGSKRLIALRSENDLYDGCTLPINLSGTENGRKKHIGIKIAGTVRKNDSVGVSLDVIDEFDGSTESFDISREFLSAPVATLKEAASGHASPVAVWGTGEKTYELFVYSVKSAGIPVATSNRSVLPPPFPSGWNTR